MRHVPGFAPGRRGDEDTAFPPHPALSHQGRGKERHLQPRWRGYKNLQPAPLTTSYAVVVVAASHAVLPREDGSPSSLIAGDETPQGKRQRHWIPDQGPG